MTKKSIVVALCILMAIAILAFLAYYAYVTSSRNRNKTQPSLVTPTISISAEPKLEKFIIIPNDYSLSPKEEQVISESSITTVLVENGGQAYIDSLAREFPGLIVIPISEASEYTFCNPRSPAEPTPTASVPSLSAYTATLQHICRNDTKVAAISVSQCVTSTPDCLVQSLIMLRSATEGLYYYFPQFPLLGIVKNSSLSIDAPFGVQIISWKESLPAVLEQISYSLEILDSAGARVHATGKMNSNNIGDFFIPTRNVAEQTLTAKVRLWMAYGTVKGSEPAILTQVFDYPNSSTPLVSSSALPVKQMSWIPDWGMADGMASIRKNPDKWDTISPVWFTPNKNGTINKERTVNSATLIKLLRDNDVRLVPTISLFDADVLHEILNKNLDTHVAEIVSLVSKNNYAGIDLDYESTYEADRTLLTEFINKLAEQLHQKNKTLSFTALPKIDDRQIYSFLPQTHQAQDWQAIGAVVDEFRIMAYDFTGQGSTQPGPLSPYRWNEALIKYAISKMPAEKVVLALPLYSHGWPKPKSSNLAGVNNDQSLSSGKQKNTISLQHSDIDYIKRHSTYYRETYDTWNKEVRAEYKYNGIERVMYYLNNKAINERIGLARLYGIKGICYWRIGDDSL